MPWPVPTTFTVMEHGIRMYYVSIVFWLGVLPFSWLLTKAMNWEAYRQSHNLCRNCGYDLRATPNRCPECGTVSTGDRS